MRLLGFISFSPNNHMPQNAGYFRPQQLTATLVKKFSRLNVEKV